jgi:carbon-monoxide dehydrogenase medium subunit
MRIRPFQYHTARSLEGALYKLNQYGPEIKPLAGGTDLVLALKQKTIAPAHLLNLLDLHDLDFVRQDDSTIRIGALARHATVATHPLLSGGLAMLAEAAGFIGSWQIRNIGTIGGNLCNASPAADSTPPLLALEAKVVVADLDGEREIPLQSFFTGPGSTSLRANQLLKEIIVPKRDCRSAGTYLKLMRKQGVDLSVVGVAFYGELDQSRQRLQRVAVAMGGVAPTPIRAPEAEAELSGLSYKKALRKIPVAAKAAVAATRPINDVRASARYRQAVVDVYVQRAASKVLEILFSKDEQR